MHHITHTPTSSMPVPGIHRMQHSTPKCNTRARTSIGEARVLVPEVNLHHQLKVAKLVVAGGGGVGAHHQLAVHSAGAGRWGGRKRQVGVSVGGWRGRRGSVGPIGLS